VFYLTGAGTFGGQQASSRIAMSGILVVSFFVLAVVGSVSIILYFLSSCPCSQRLGCATCVASMNARLSLATSSLRSSCCPSLLCFESYQAGGGANRGGGNKEGRERDVRGGGGGRGGVGRKNKHLDWV
jgi:hypothetical protein